MERAATSWFALVVLAVLGAVLAWGLAWGPGIAPARASTYKGGDGFKVSSSGMSRPTVLKKGASFSLKGTLSANRKISKLVITVRDLDRFTTDLRVVKKPGSKKANMARYASAVRFQKLSSGEKRLDVAVQDADGNKAVLKRRFTVLGKAKEPAHITKKCSIKVSKGRAANVTDSSDDTYWSGGTMTIKLPKGKEADGLLVKWYRTKNSYTLKSYDAKGRKLDAYSGADAGGKLLHRYYKLSEGARKVVVRLKYKKGNHGIVGLRVYAKGRVGVSVEQWKSPKTGACDLMVVSAHRDDELLYFGGTIPYYQSVRGKNVYLMYVSGADKLRCREALAGQWALGNTTHPIFLNFPGGYHNGISGTLADWGGESKVIGKLVEKIRKYRPKVIVSHDLNGEYGHPTHRTVAYAIKKAVKAAGDKSQYKASAKKYGAWKVKKLYLHMYSSNKVKMNYGKRFAALDWKTPYQAACVGYDKHYSQHGRWSMSASYVKKYPSTNYGLVYTRVGKDKKKNDLFEHVD